ncbi:hypothetical protein PG993_000054 [Apiospora rasikravindrae]|uniref:CBM-cenC domain-containing protein n=1 Tax=Apiospora rasikravindrae TaxID=990691 RepID=A0ABR1U7H3_9PEZI
MRHTSSICYRALFPCASSAALATASAYCKTITASGITATNYPTRAVSACGTTPARYLSACGCGPTCTTATPMPTLTPPCPAPNPTSGNILPNSDFECGLAPWTPQVPDPSASYLVTNKAADAHTGTHAFEVTLHAAPSTPEQGVNARILSPSVGVVQNVPYRLAFWLRFSDLRCGFVGVMINGQPLRTVDAADNGSAVIRNWTENQVDYTPSTGSVRVKFEYVLGLAVPCTVRLDTVSLAPLH